MKRRTKRKLIIFALILAALLAAASYFLYVFYVPDEQAEVLGNIRCTDAEIRRAVMPGFLEHNSLYLRFFRSETEFPDDPLLQSVEVEYLAPGSVRLHANESWPVGYLLQDGRRYYFNASGIVTESLEDGSAQKEEKKQEETGAAASEPGLTEETGAQSDTSFRPALADVALVSGLTDRAYAVGEQIEADDLSLFQTLLIVGKLANKLNIHPDEIVFDEQKNLSLRYGEVLVRVGTDRLMEEKMSRASAILPQLEGMKGTLHLENYETGTMNIIFSSDTEDDGYAEQETG